MIEHLGHGKNKPVANPRATPETIVYLDIIRLKSRDARVVKVKAVSLAIGIELR